MLKIWKRAFAPPHFHYWCQKCGMFLNTATEPAMAEISGEPFTYECKSCVDERTRPEKDEVVTDEVKDFS